LIVGGVVDLQGAGVDVAQYEIRFAGTVYRAMPANCQSNPTELLEKEVVLPIKARLRAGCVIACGDSYSASTRLIVIARS
jgi:hypothetical protein